jgi:hypothetical protein
LPSTKLNRNNSRINCKVFDIDNFIIQPNANKITQKTSFIAAIKIPKYEMLNFDFLNDVNDCEPENVKS